MSYDRAITVFSPDGHLFQVEYAMEAVKRGSSVIGVRTPTCVILAVERRATPLLQDPRPIRKILTLDDHVQCAFAGLTADARVLLNLARQECQSYRLTCEDAPSVEYVARYVARRQQEYTQRGGVRPFGISTMMGGFDGDKACLMQTDPAGTFSEWKANAVGGKNAKVMREFLEKGWTENMSEADGVKLAIKALLEVVDSGAKNMEIVCVRKDGKVSMKEEDIAVVVETIKAESEQGEGNEMKD
ncbi:hypothetical protein ScalyP_jg7252 [Parmales sp. scaly parma]|nr:hypothetical protein ScalyP_jg7252 [Parmales sp. scaly parma]